ncbi:MAG: LptF/LptG family permease [Candidatus Eremiobacteraeota bacterium]|nr:LptF/LptG family permease [Candidatus Eremiobacteraeota bacterium]
MIATTGRRLAIRLDALRITTLDRYMIGELAGPFIFGFSAFMLIFVATNLLALSRLISEEHAAWWAVIEYFFWGLPQVVPYVVPMATLLAVLLAMQRLSGESEVVAMKAGGVSLERMAVPLLVVGFILSVVTLFIEQTIVPYANDRATEIMQVTIRHAPALGTNLTVYTPLPDGGRQLTAATGYDASTQSLLNVTVIQYDRTGTPQTIIFGARARAQSNTSWTFDQARTYRFDPDGTTLESTQRTLIIDIGEGPTSLLKRAKGTPQEMSRSEIAQVIRTGQLTGTQLGQYIAEYQSQLARPFACLVFALLAVPFGMRRVRGGGTSVGFGLAVAIVFIYYVVMTISNSLGTLNDTMAFLMAWFPNVLFFAIGLVLLRRASYGQG